MGSRSTPHSPERRPGSRTVLSGIAAGAVNPTLETVELKRVPEHMRGRVSGFINAGAWPGTPFGALLGGIAADTIGVGFAFGVVAVLYTLVTRSPSLSVLRT